MQLDSVSASLAEPGCLVVSGLSSIPVAYVCAFMWCLVVSERSSTSLFTCASSHITWSSPDGARTSCFTFYTHSSSPDGARQYGNINVWTCFGCLWMQLDVNVLLSRSRISCSRLRMELDVIFYMLHSLGVSLESSTLWTHIFHYVLVVCGCSSIIFVQTCS